MTVQDLIAEATSWLKQAAHNLKEGRPVVASGWSYVASARLDTAQAQGAKEAEVRALREQAEKVRAECAAMLAVTL